ncbi:MAG: ABC transporter substrate-binding protein [Tissierellales bacterium]|nr:ABC transporter substrate-binding protein [Tissierellales bacterium]
MRSKSLKFMAGLGISLMVMMSLVGCGGSASEVKDSEGSEKTKVSAQAEKSPEETKFGGTINVAQKMTPPHLDSDKSTDWAISSIMNHVYEGLFEFDAEFKPQPHLAKEYTLSEDSKVYTVKLREGVKFHDGSEMTADDVKASFERWLKNNDAGNMIKPYFDKLEVVSPYEVKFVFNEPYAPFISVIASHVSNQKLVIRPKELIEKYGDNILEEHIGTGPYKFVGWIPDQYVNLERFDEYMPSELPASGLAGKRVAYADNISIKFIAEQSTRVAGTQTGEFMFAEEAPQDQYELLTSDGNVEPVIVKPDGMEMIIINNGTAPFDNKDMRRALAYAIDMEEFGRTMIGNEAFWTVDGSIFPKGTIWYEENSGKGVYNNYDTDKAKELLAKSNYDGTPIVILSGQDDKIEAQGAIALKSQLEKAGFNVKVELFDRPTVVDKRSKKDGWNLHLSYFYMACPDPQVQSAWTGTNAWISNWDDEDSKQMDEIFARMMKETDFDKRFDIVKEFYAKTWESLPYIKSVEYSRMHLLNSKLKGYANGAQPYFWNTWIEK